MKKMFFYGSTALLACGAAIASITFFLLQSHNVEKETFHRNLSLDGSMGVASSEGISPQSTPVGYSQGESMGEGSPVNLSRHSYTPFSIPFKKMVFLSDQGDVNASYHVAKIIGVCIKRHGGYRNAGELHSYVREFSSESTVYLPDKDTINKYCDTVPNDWSMAISHSRIAANEGNTNAMILLSKMLSAQVSDKYSQWHASGENLDYQLVDAMIQANQASLGYLRSAAETGNEKAIRQLILNLQYGLKLPKEETGEKDITIIERNYLEAYAWSFAAEIAGFGWGKHTKDNIYMQSNGLVEIEPADAMGIRYYEEFLYDNNM